MLFLAVFCGFLAENQREHYIEKVRARQYARSLVNDLKRDTVMVNWIIGEMKSSNRWTDSLILFLHDKPIEQIRNIDLFILTSGDEFYSFRIVMAVGNAIAIGFDFLIEKENPSNGMIFSGFKTVDPLPSIA